MSSIQDMNNRIAQNRKLRPSQREKFKNNRETIHSGKENAELKFKEFTGAEVNQAIQVFRNQAAKERIWKIVLFIILLFFTVYVCFKLLF